MNLDSRKFHRIDLPLEVALVHRGECWPSLQAENLCAGGVIVRSRLLLQVGSTVELAISPPGGGPEALIRVRGNIARVLDGEMGIEFTEIDARSYAHLKNLLLYNADDPEAVECEFASHLGIRRQRRLSEGDACPP